MYKWDEAVLTTAGHALLAKLTSGNSLTLIRAVAGAGYVDPATLQYQSAVTDVRQELKFSTQSYPEEGKCAVPVRLYNTGLTTGYTAKQIGIYAMDPDQGEILYLIAQAATDGTDIPAESEMPGYSAEWTFYLAYGQADSVNVTVDPANAVTEKAVQSMIAGHDAAQTPHAGVLATQKALNDHATDTSNPHGVTKEQLGLGNVDNTSDTNKYVAYAQRAGEADKTKYALTLRLNGGRTEGSDSWTYDGSTSRTINVTPEKIGAAEVEHSHDVSDVSGAVSLEELPNLYIWEKWGGEPGKPVVSSQLYSNVQLTWRIETAQSSFSTISYADSVTIVDNKINLENKQTLDLGTGATPSRCEVLRGKYIFAPGGMLATDDAYYFIPEDATFTCTTTSVIVSSARKVSVATRVKYVAARASNAYPENGAHTDGYWYIYHKQLGE